MDLKYAPFSSSINPGFWNSFTKLKLEVLGLEENALEVEATYSNKDQKDLPAMMNVDWDAFESPSKPKNLTWNAYSVKGNVINYNTMEAFKKFDKVQYLNGTESKILLDAIQSDKVLEDPRILSRFVIHMFADLKKYHYYYWFAFPAFVLPKEIQLQKKPTLISEEFSEDKCKAFSSAYQTWKKDNPKQSGYFWIHSDKEIIYSLKEGMENQDQNLILGFADPSTLPEYPGWPLRNLLALISLKRPEKLQEGIKILALRQKAINSELSIGSSLMLTVQCSSGEYSRENWQITGWEKNDKGQFAPKFANMKASMDPKSLAESSVDLNLKLMKWRLVPDLDLNKMYNVKCLLLGSGTLGCNVARCLLGWGVKNITFVDNGKVSYSNPVRQSLFNFEDCLEGGKPKAETASETLKKIFPGVQTKGYTINIPMPGHPISDSLKPKVQNDYESLEELIKSHDVIYLLMDTRESRWLPTVMAAHHGKLVINAALGFDSFLVMRHGIRNQDSWTADIGSNLKGCVPGNQLGCYFCNDVVAPGDSTKDRTLDQQCTVTRPGVSYQAAAFAVELMASVLQHPQGLMASSSIGPAENEEGPLGETFHSLRGSISNFHFTRPTTQRFSNCTACSQKVLEEFAQKGFQLLLATSDNPKYLEDLTGLSNLMSDMNFDDVIVCSDDDF